MLKLRTLFALVTLTLLSAAFAQHITLADGSTLDQWDAQVMCEQQVKDRLKAPSTAKFPGAWGGNTEQARLFGNTWVYNVVVDAQNGFGAMIRSTFVCTLDGDAGTIGITEAGY